MTTAIIDGGKDRAETIQQIPVITTEFYDALEEAQALTTLLSISNSETAACDELEKTAIRGASRLIGKSIGRMAASFSEIQLLADQTEASDDDAGRVQG